MRSARSGVMVRHEGQVEVVKRRRRSAEVAAEDWRSVWRSEGRRREGRCRFRGGWEEIGREIVRRGWVWRVAVVVGARRLRVLVRGWHVEVRVRVGFEVKRRQLRWWTRMVG